MKKRLYVYFLIVALFLVSTTALPQPKAPARATAVASLSTITQKVNFRVSWVEPQQVDSTLIAVFLSSDTTPVIYRRGRSPDTVSFTIPDDTTTYRFMLISLRRGMASRPANVNFYFNADQYYKVTRLHIRPREVTVDTGGKVHFCAFIEYNDGSIVIRDRDKDNPTCITEYSKFDSGLRKSLGARLRNANAVCLQWQATGGTIENEVCSNP